MVAAANLVEVAALVGDTARATMLAALMGGEQLTGTELAFLARVSRPTASEHLAKLVEARLVAITKQGRYRYYRIASPLVARMLESIIAVAAIEVPSRHQPRSAYCRRGMGQPRERGAGRCGRVASGAAYLQRGDAQRGAYRVAAGHCRAVACAR